MEYRIRPYSILIQKSKGSSAFDEQKVRISQSNIDYNRFFPTLCVLNIKMSSKDKPKAAKCRKNESFFNKPAVAVTDATDSRSAAVHVERASMIRASLVTAGSTSTENEQNNSDEGEYEAESHETQEDNQTDVEEDRNENANCAGESAESARDFIDIYQPYFTSTSVSDQGLFIDTTLATIDEMKPLNEIAKNDYGIRLYFMLKKSNLISNHRVFVHFLRGVPP